MAMLASRRVSAIPVPRSGPVVSVEPLPAPRRVDAPAAAGHVETLSGARHGRRPGARPPVVLGGALDAAAAALAATWAVLAAGVPGPAAGVLGGAAALLWLAALALVRSRRPRLRRSLRDSVGEVLVAALALLCTVALAGLVLGVALPREVALAGVGTTAALTLAGRGLSGWQGRRGAGQRARVTVVGPTAAGVRRFLEEQGSAPDRGYDVVAACLVDEGTDDLGDVAVFHGLAAVDEIVDAVGTDAVVVIDPSSVGPDHIRRLAWRLEKHEIRLFVVPTLPDVSVRRMALSEVGGTVVVEMRHAELEGARRLVKEAFDRVVAAVALTAVLPLLAALVLAVRIETPGPGLFRQERVGKNGRRFTMLKLRTMTADAEARRDELLAHNDLDGVLFKMQDDPRVTRVGALLRRYSLDELPQLVNVLCGHMSLVGPRPPLPSEVAAYDEPVHRRLAVKPGITGLWQVSGRSNLSWAESVRLDLRYVEDWSWRMDAAILWRTGRAVLRQDGAY